MKYSDISNEESLNPNEMFEMKGGYVCQNYGCESGVCEIDRSGAKDLCDTAYCRRGVGPVNPSVPICRASM